MLLLPFVRGTAAVKATIPTVLQAILCIERQNVLYQISQDR